MNSEPAPPICCIVSPDYLRRRLCTLRPVCTTPYPSRVCLLSLSSLFPVTTTADCFCILYLTQVTMRDRNRSINLTICRTDRGNASLFCQQKPLLSSLTIEDMMSMRERVREDAWTMYACTSPHRSQQVRNHYYTPTSPPHTDRKLLPLLRAGHLCSFPM